MEERGQEKAAIGDLVDRFSTLQMTRLHDVGQDESLPAAPPRLSPSPPPPKAPPPPPPRRRGISEAAAARARRNSELLAPSPQEAQQKQQDRDTDGGGDLEDESIVSSSAAAARAAALASAPPPEPCASWEWLPEGPLCNILSRLGAPALRRARLTCRRWRACADTGAVESLAPRGRARVGTIAAQFPSLKALDLGGCANLRNRSLAVLAGSGLRLRALAIGGGGGGAVQRRSPDAAAAAAADEGSNDGGGFGSGRPRVSNAGLASLSELTKLRSLALSDCASVTNAGLVCLSSLVELRALAICRCPRVGDR